MKITTTPQVVVSVSGDQWVTHCTHIFDFLNANKLLLLTGHVLSSNGIPSTLARRQCNYVVLFWGLPNICRVSSKHMTFGASTTLEGRRFQMSTIQIEKNHFLMLKFACCTNSLKLYSQVLYWAQMAFASTLSSVMSSCWKVAFW